jgi:hypothetical protein
MPIGVRLKKDNQYKFKALTFNVACRAALLNNDQLQKVERAENTSEAQR